MGLLSFLKKKDVNKVSNNNLNIPKPPKDLFPEINQENNQSSNLTNNLSNKGDISSNNLSNTEMNNANNNINDINDSVNDKNNLVFSKNNKLEDDLEDIPKPPININQNDINGISSVNKNNTIDHKEFMPEHEIINNSSKSNENAILDDADNKNNHFDNKEELIFKKEEKNNKENSVNNLKENDLELPDLPLPDFNNDINSINNFNEKNISSKNNSFIPKEKSIDELPKINDDIINNKEEKSIKTIEKSNNNQIINNDDYLEKNNMEKDSLFLSEEKLIIDSQNDKYISIDYYLKIQDRIKELKKLIRASEDKLRSWEKIDLSFEQKEAKFIDSIKKVEELLITIDSELFESD